MSNSSAPGKIDEVRKEVDRLYSSPPWQIAARPEVSASTMEVLWPSFRMSDSCPCVRQGACSCGILSRHLSSTLIARLRASSGAASFSLAGSEIAEFADGRQISLQPGSVQCGLVQVLRRAHEGAGPAAHRTDQGLEIAAAFPARGNEYLLRAFRHRDRQAVASAFCGPGLAGKKPAWWRRIGGTAQKCGYLSNGPIEWRASQP